MIEEHSRRIFPNFQLNIIITDQATINTGALPQAFSRRQVTVEQQTTLHLSENAIRVLEARYLRRDAQRQIVESP
ncbi:MAG: hypothetical protein WCD63_00340, partial [Terrimicrobiaceae bacterium]